MSENERDTHFQSFAKMLFDEMHARHHGIDIGGKEYYEDQVAEYERIIARRAYDLVCHSQQFMPGVENVPDLTEWPEQGE